MRTDGELWQGRLVNATLDEFDTIPYIHTPLLLQFTDRRRRCSLLFCERPARFWSRERPNPWHLLMQVYFRTPKKYVHSMKSYVGCHPDDLKESLAIHISLFSCILCCWAPFTLEPSLHSQDYHFCSTNVSFCPVLLPAVAR